MERKCQQMARLRVLDGHERRLAESAGAGGLTSIMGLLYPECRRKDFKLPPGALIQRPTGLELRTLGSQAATLTTEPTPG